MAFKQPDHKDRKQAAVEARKAALEKFRSKPGPGDPEFEAREQERRAIIAAREQRQTEKDAIAAEKRAREERERELAEIALREDIDRRDRERAEQDERDRQLEIERKAERDARYAARKARQKKK
jgi:hypothetical protein